jgi:hypothetical protein
MCTYTTFFGAIKCFFIDVGLAIGAVALLGLIFSISLYFEGKK